MDDILFFCLKMHIDQNWNERSVSRDRSSRLTFNQKCLNPEGTLILSIHEDIWNNYIKIIFLFQDI